MKTNDIVAGGGWVRHRAVGRPKTHLFFILSVVWLGVAIIASAAFWRDSWPPAFSGAEWVGLLLMLPEPVFLILAIKFALTELPQNIITRQPNPDVDPRKLY